MPENYEPGPLLDDPLTGMEACIRISYLVRLGCQATAEEVAEVSSLEASLPSPPCVLCPRSALADALDDGDFVQPAGRPCMIPREILVRGLRGAESYNGHKAA
jgi:hypothetical protein